MNRSEDLDHKKEEEKLQMELNIILKDLATSFR